MTTCARCGEPFPVASSLRFCPACAAPVPGAPGDPLLGQTLAGRYLVVSRIGEGGMGRVYAAEQAIGATRRRVAVKLLLPAFAEEPQLVARFLNEVGLVAQLEHPNTVRVHDSGRTERGQLFVVMELVSGVPLSQVIAGGPLDLPRMDGIVAQICGSLDEAHRKGIVHRDLKPDNVLLTTIGGDEDVVKVVDFGIAQSVEAVEGGARTRLTRHGEILGTPAYMSPEQFGGGDVDARSDVYALGVMIYEMACGRLPFRAEGLAQWALCHASASPAPLEGTPAGAALPSTLKAAILRALAKNPSDRPQTARELYAEMTVFRDRQSSAPWSHGRAAAPASTVPAAPLPLGDGMATEAAMVRPVTTSSRSAIKIPAPPRSARTSAPGWSYALVGGVAGAVLVGVSIWGLSGPKPSVAPVASAPAPPASGAAAAPASPPAVASAKNPSPPGVLDITTLPDASPTSVSAPPPHPCVQSLNAKPVGKDQCTPIDTPFRACPRDHPLYAKAKAHRHEHCIDGGHGAEHARKRPDPAQELVDGFLGKPPHDDHDH